MSHVYHLYRKHVWYCSIIPWAGCPKGEFECSSGRCLSRSRWCNDNPDCEDGEDELSDACWQNDDQPSFNGSLDYFADYEDCDLCYCNSPDAEKCTPPFEPSKTLETCKTAGDSGRNVSVEKLDIAPSKALDGSDPPGDEISGTSATRPEDRESSGEASASDYQSRRRRSYWETWFVPGITGSSSYVSQSIVNDRIDDPPDSEVHSRLQMKFQPPDKSSELDNSFSLVGNSDQQVHGKADSLVRSDKEIYGFIEPLALGGLGRFTGSYKDKTVEGSASAKFLNSEFLKYRRVDKAGRNPLEMLLKDGSSGCSMCKNSQKTGKFRKEHPYGQLKYYDEAKMTHRVRRGINAPLETGINLDGALKSWKPSPETIIAGDSSRGEGQTMEGVGTGQESSGSSDLADAIFNQSRDHLSADVPLHSGHCNGSHFEDVFGMFEKCYCELKWQLKCIHADFHSIPTHVIGGIKWLAINASNIKTLDPCILSQYKSLEVLDIQNSLLRYILDKNFVAQENLKFLYLSWNYIETIETNGFIGLRAVQTISLDRNHLRQLDLSCFRHALNLTSLDLSHNFLNFRDNQSFPKLKLLEKLNLNYNKIRRVSSLLLRNLPNLEVLRLGDNEIEAVLHGAFSSLTKLEKLDLSGNRLQSVSGLFKELSSLNLLMLEKLQLNDISEEHFADLRDLKVIYFSTFRYCSYVPRVPPPQCMPNHNGFSNTRDLVGWKALRVGVWVMAFITVLGNVLVIFCRVLSRKDISRSNNNILFIKNLASADLLMGVYLVIMGVKDAQMKGTFLANSLQWAESYTCTVAGILATVSSEASMFILTFMSLERYLCVSNPYRDPLTLSEKKASFCLLVIWLSSLILAIFPAFTIYGFYGTNTMCYPLYINEPFLLGWQYSAFLFLGLNSISLMLIIWSYTRLFLTRRQCIACTTLGAGEFAFAVRFFFIVFTNCLCWFPIICIKAAALALVDINGGVYAWLVILVLPINSAVNPVLYTFSTSRFKKHFEKLSNAIYCFYNIRRRQSSDTDTLPNSSGPSYHTSHTTLQNQSMEASYPEHLNHVLPDEVTFVSPSLGIVLTAPDHQHTTKPLTNEDSSDYVDENTVTMNDGKTETVPEQDLNLTLASPQDQVFLNSRSSQQRLLSTESVPQEDCPSQNNRQQRDMPLLQKGHNGSSVSKFSGPGIRSKVVKFAHDLTIRKQILHSVLSYGDNKSTSKKNSGKANLANSPLTNCSQEELEEVE
ncbi:uncharacterized protein LOC135207868 isoform X2 [Macrobrachium nipponense]|uniref:uncharacterized protein LOC135207868 isoform X2 n=1 Tax=Macrobrachium nipponense TaxID=159736 RepID=UPI0030C87985